MFVFRSAEPADIEAEAKDAASAGEKVVNVRLYVEHANDAAKATYSRLGFCDAGYNVMEMPKEA